MKWLVIGGYCLSVLHIHFRGRVRLPLRRQLVDHSTFMAPINVFMHLFSKVPSKPFIPLSDFPELERLQESWQVIRFEALNLLALTKGEASEKYDQTGFNAVLKNGRKRFYLKWYDAVDPAVQRLCPRTFALLQSIPCVTVARFAELLPGDKLTRHRDPFAGQLRYHLGVSTPNDDRCFIEVDGQRYSWRDGRGMMFDETYIHWAINDSDSPRIVLLCDIERPMRFRWAQAVNHLLGRTLMTATSSPGDTGEQGEAVGKLLRVMSLLGQQRRRLKSWSMTAYKLTLMASMVAVVALVYWL